MNIFKQLYNYRELLKSNIKKEVRGRYKHSFLGVLWSFLNPLLQLLVYSVIFGALLANGDNTYHIYICVGLIPWTFFTNTIIQGTLCVVTNGNIVQKVYFPREILPISTVVSGAINFIIATIIILVFVAVSGLGFTPYVLLYPFILLIQCTLLLGINFILSAVTIYIRDLENIVSVILMAAFYATPIVYKLQELPANLQIFMQLNPMTHIINGYRDIFYYQQMPNLQNLGILFALSILLTVIGYFAFKKMQRGFAEEL